MSGRIFINYRRGDDPGFTGRLFDFLEHSFSPDQLFIDVDNIPAGADFVQVLGAKVEACDVMLSVIGRGWLEAQDEQKRRRLDDPYDFVRIEIETALQQGKRVVPVLVNGADMPRAETLPASLKPFSRRNAVRLTHERFRMDAQGLVRAIEEALSEADAARQAAEAEARRKAQQARLEAERRKQMETVAARPDTSDVPSQSPADNEGTVALSGGQEQAAASQETVLTRLVRSPREFGAAALFLPLGVIAFGNAPAYQPEKVAQFGRSSDWLLNALPALMMLFGTISLVRSFFVKGPPIERVVWRPLLLIPLAIVLFALLLQRAGALVALLQLGLLSALALPTTTFDWRTLATYGSVIFIALAILNFGLNVNVPLIGPWLIP